MCFTIRLLPRFGSKPQLSAESSLATVHAVHLHIHHSSVHSPNTQQSQEGLTTQTHRHIQRHIQRHTQIRTLPGHERGGGVGGEGGGHAEEPCGQNRIARAGEKDADDGAYHKGVAVDGGYGGEHEGDEEHGAEEEERGDDEALGRDVPHVVGGDDDEEEVGEVVGDGEDVFEVVLEDRGGEAR